jgi:hypothetical protein
LIINNRIDLRALDCKAAAGAEMVMSDTPIQGKPPPALDRILAAHQRRARIIAQLHEQAIATASDLSVQHRAIRGGTAKDAGRGKAEAWFSADVFLLALGCIVGVGCILAASVSWQ